MQELKELTNEYKERLKFITKDLENIKNYKYDNLIREDIKVDAESLFVVLIDYINLALDINNAPENITVDDAIEFCESKGFISKDFKEVALNNINIFMGEDLDIDDILEFINNNIEILKAEVKVMEDINIKLSK
ncbi:hypothetical protein [Clostridium mediterraneense]|uniref:hypothetical protein n=1 Tax=Clostridium mediterraneense TaxID=1805472 RepID=UPI00082C39CB|nr:hypothetical protein [Clostridium mediterraneense]